MPTDNFNEKPIVRVLNFRGAGENDAPIINSSSSTFPVQPSTMSERISYTVSYPGVAVNPVPEISIDELADALAPVAEKVVNEVLEKLASSKM